MIPLPVGLALPPKALSAISAEVTWAPAEAVTALANIIGMRFLWETKKSRTMKIHALRSISRIRDDGARKVVERALKAPEKYLRWEAERILKKLGHAAPA